MKESIAKKGLAVSLGLTTALGLTACGNPFSGHSNNLSECEINWVDNSIGINEMVTDMPTAMAALEAGRNTLVTDIQQGLGTSNNYLKVADIPAKYRVATELLIGRSPNGQWYDTTDAKLDTPRAEFCQEDGYLSVFKTPGYVNAEAALTAAGIDIDSQSH